MYVYVCVFALVRVVMMMMGSSGGCSVVVIGRVVRAVVVDSGVGAWGGWAGAGLLDLGVVQREVDRLSLLHLGGVDYSTVGSQRSWWSTEK